MDHDIYSSGDAVEDVTNEFLRALDKRPKLYSEADSAQKPNVHFVIKMGSQARLEEGMRAVKSMAANSKVLVGVICVQDNREEESHKVVQPLIEESNIMCIQLHCYGSSGNALKLHNCKCNRKMMQFLASFLQEFGAT